jgi:hypothetical protein
MWGVYGSGIKTGASGVPRNEALASACPYDTEVTQVTQALLSNSTLGFANLTASAQKNLVAVGTAQLFVPCVAKTAAAQFQSINASIHETIYPITYVNVVNGALNITLPATTPLNTSVSTFVSAISGVIASKQAPVIANASMALNATLSVEKRLQPGYYTTIGALVILVFAIFLAFKERKSQ